MLVQSLMTALAPETARKRGVLEVIKAVGFSAAVADAHAEIKKHSHFICQNPGGKGAVREFIEFILSTQQKWETIQENVKNLKPKKDWG